MSSQMPLLGFSSGLNKPNCSPIMEKKNRNQLANPTSLSRRSAYGMKIQKHTIMVMSIVAKIPYRCGNIARASAATYPVHHDLWSHDLLARESQRKHHESAWTRQTAQWYKNLTKLVVAPNCYIRQQRI